MISISTSISAPIGAAGGTIGGSATGAPFTVISVKSLDELLKDARRITGAQGGEQGSPIDAFLSRFGGSGGLPGIDSTQPFGLCIATQGEAFAGQLLIPVKDSKAFLGLLGVPASAAQGPDGRTFVVQIFGSPLYARTTRGYCSLSSRKSDVESPANPSCLGPGPYDISLQCNFGQLPQAKRRELLSALSAQLDSSDAQAVGIAKTMRSGRGGGFEFGYEQGFRFASELRRKQLQRLFEDGEKLLVGLNFDSSSGALTLDWETTARAGSPLARDYNALASALPAFGGLFSSDAPLSACVCVAMPEELIEFLRGTLGQGYEVAQAEVDKSPVFSNVQDRANAHDSLSSMAQAFEGLKELNFAFSLTATPTGKPQVSLAVKVSSGKALSSAFQGWGKFPPNAFEPGEFKLNAAQHSGVPIHRITIPPMVGEPFGGTSIHMAVRGESAFFALGSESLASVRSSLERTGTPGPRRPPVSVRLVPSKLLGLLPGLSEQEQRIFKAFRGSGDHVTFEMIPLRDGTKGRLSVGEGFLRAIAAGVNGPKKQ